LVFVISQARNRHAIADTLLATQILADGFRADRCRRLFDVHCAANPTITVDKHTAVQFLREALDRITVEVLQRAWAVSASIPEDDDDEWEEIGQLKVTHLPCL
jgi:hypothetical protein